MSISDQQDGGECEVGTGVRHRVHHLPAWRHPHLLEGVVLVVLVVVVIMVVLVLVVVRVDVLVVVIHLFHSEYL